MLTLLLNIYPKIVNPIMKSVIAIYFKITFAFTKMYRVLNARKTSDFVWKELISYHKKAGWKYGQFEKERQIECRFSVDDSNVLDFYYTITNSKLTFNSIILSKFDEERTNDILVLASHFNGLLNFGVVKVNLKYNFVEFAYSGDILNYSIFPDEIDSDTITHFRIVKDCFWSFNELIISGEDPVFVFSELMRRKEEKDNSIK